MPFLTFGSENNPFARARRHHIPTFGWFCPKMLFLQKIVRNDVSSDYLYKIRTWIY